MFGCYFLLMQIAPSAIHVVNALKLQSSNLFSADEDDLYSKKKLLKDRGSPSFPPTMQTNLIL